MSFVLWMTGLPCSGKSTISRRLQDVIPNMEVLDGDQLYDWLGPYEFTKEARLSQTIRVANIAKLLLKHDVPVCAAMISSYHESRKTARTIINDNRFLETYLKCSLETCEKRDDKGLYKKARSGEIENFTGINDPYEIPTNPEIIIDTEKSSIEENVKKILDYLKSRKLIS